MPYEVLEKQIKALPSQCLDEVAEFVEYVRYKHEKQNLSKETLEEEQARKQAAIQEMLDWAKAVHCRSTEDWTREELYDRGL